MDVLAITGYACLGAFVGLLVGWFVNSPEEPNPKSYSAIIAASAGAAAAFIPFFSPLVGREVWFYPIALLIGLLIAPFFDVGFNWFYGLKKVKQINKSADY